MVWLPGGDWLGSEISKGMLRALYLTEWRTLEEVRTLDSTEQPAFSPPIGKWEPRENEPAVKSNQSRYLGQITVVWYVHAERSEIQNPRDPVSLKETPVTVALGESISNQVFA